MIRDTGFNEERIESSSHGMSSVSASTGTAEKQLMRRTMTLYFPNQKFG
jgi:hypothetical protein